MSSIEVVLSLVWAHLFKICILIALIYYVYKNYLSNHVYNAIYTTKYEETMTEDEVKRRAVLAREYQQRSFSVVSSQDRRDRKRHNVVPVDEEEEECTA